MKFNRLDVLALLMSVMPLLYLYFYFDSFPERIVTHWSLNGEPNGWTGRENAWILITGFGVLSIAIYFLVKFLPRIDPKKSAILNASLYPKLSIAVVLFLSVLNLWILYASRSAAAAKPLVALVILIGMLFTYLGNVMYNVKPNYFVGIRIPWTLENEDNWKLTHRFAGKLWFGGGLLTIVLAFLLPLVFILPVFLSIIVLITLSPVVYSFYLFQKAKSIL